MGLVVEVGVGDDLDQPGTVAVKVARDDELGAFLEADDVPLPAGIRRIQLGGPMEDFRGCCRHVRRPESCLKDLGLS